MMPKRNRRLLNVILASCAAFAAGCAETGPRTVVIYKPKPPSAPRLRYCCDATGHKPGAKPFIFGGTCCCTPSRELIRQFHRDGFLKGYTAKRLQSAYRARGITTDNDHGGCNNACQYGPHVVKGGRCMATPTPGTANYDQVISGRFEPPSQEKEIRHERK